MRPFSTTPPAAMVLLVISLGLEAGAVHAAPTPAPQDIDPRPPVVHTPPKSDFEPRRHERAIEHSKPRPLATGAIATDWPRFLGPTGDGHSPETPINKTLPEDHGPLKPLWELRRGSGYAAPAVAGRHMVYTHRLADEVIVECLHPETGRQYWSFKYPSDYRDRYGYNNGPRANPLIDDGRVYVYGVQGQLHCLDLATGTPIWSRQLQDEFDIDPTFFGIGTSPVVEGDLLVLNLGAPRFQSKAGKGAAVAAFDKRTGRLRWHSGDHWGPSYASPLVATIHGRRRLLVLGGADSRPPSGGLLMLDPATGKAFFHHPFRSETYESVIASNPVVVGNEVFITASYDTGSALLRIGADGAATPVWTNPSLGAHMNTLLHHEGQLYGFDGRNERDAQLVCIDWKTGEQRWATELVWDETLLIRGKPVPQRMGTFRGSLMRVDGAFLCLGEAGHLLWLELTPKGHRVLGRSRLFLARETWGLPVLSRGLLYVCQNTPDLIDRTPERLLCYDLRGERP